jgi:hypothetical protein
MQRLKWAAIGLAVGLGLMAAIWFGWLKEYLAW